MLDKIFTDSNVVFMAATVTVGVYLKQLIGNRPKLKKLLPFFIGAISMTFSVSHAILCNLDLSTAVGNGICIWGVATVGYDGWKAIVKQGTGCSEDEKKV